MKKVLLGLSLMMAFASGSFAQKKATTKKSTPSNQVVGWFSAGTFGCWGWDFCNGDAPWDKKGTSWEQLNTDNTITFTIPLSALNDKNKEFYADKDEFRVEHESLLDPNECAALGLEEGAKFVKGIYPLEITNNSLKFTVKIDLR